jgi:hypothetical protein
MRTEPKTPGQTLWIIWIALFASVVMYVAIGLYVPLSTEALPDETVKLLTQVLGFVSLANLGLVFGMKGVLAKRMPYPAFCIVRWALCESVALFGLVLHFIGASLETMGAFALAAAFAMVIVRPSDGDRDSYTQAKTSV